MIAKYSTMVEMANKNFAIAKQRQQPNEKKNEMRNSDNICGQDTAELNATILAYLH